MAYKRPTLVETYAELHLSAGALPQPRFFDVVPQLKALGFIDIEIASVGALIEITSGSSLRRETQQRVRCWKPGRTQLVQVGEDLIVVNLTGKYPGWDAFIQLFAQARHALEAGIGKVAIASISHVALDTIDVPRNGFALSRIVNVGGQIVPRWYSECGESADLDMGRGLLDIDGHNDQVHINVHASSDPVRVVLRTEFRQKQNSAAEPVTVLANLHAKANAAFEAIITDYVRNDIMGGRI